MATDRIGKLKEMLAKQPNDSFLLHALALENVKLNDDNTARRLFEQVLANEPGYVGSYYHLGKLLERTNEIDEAIKVYEEGMKQAKAAKDNHAYNELQAAQEDISDF